MIGDISKNPTSNRGGRANRLDGLPEERIGYPDYRERLFRQNYRLSAAVSQPEGVIERFKHGSLPAQRFGRQVGEGWG